MFHYFPIAGKFLPICTLTNNITINIFIPLKAGLPPNQSYFEKVKIVRLAHHPELWLILWYTNFVLSSCLQLLAMMLVKCLWICLCHQPQIRSAGHLKELIGTVGLERLVVESCLKRGTWNTPCIITLML